MPERDLSGLRAYADEVTAEFEQLQQNLGELQRGIAAVRATARSDDGYVTATVGPRGQLIRLDLDGRIYRRPDSRWLADLIAATVQRATTEAARKVDEVSAKYAPSADVRSLMEGRVADRLRRFDFMVDQTSGAAE